MSDAAADFRQAERRLREMLFGDGTTTVGIVKGEERRLQASSLLRRMKRAFDDAVDQEAAQAALARAVTSDLEEELRRLAAQQTQGRTEMDG